MEAIRITAAAVVLAAAAAAGAQVDALDPAELSLAMAHDPTPALLRDSDLTIALRGADDARRVIRGDLTGGADLSARVHALRLDQLSLQIGAGASLHNASVSHDDFSRLSSDLSDQNTLALVPRLALENRFFLAGRPASASVRYEFQRDWRTGPTLDEVFSAHRFTCSGEVDVTPWLSAGSVYQVSLDAFDDAGTDDEDSRDGQRHAMSAWATLRSTAGPSLTVGYRRHEADTVGDLHRARGHGLFSRAALAVHGPLQVALGAAWTWNDSGVVDGQWQTRAFTQSYSLSLNWRWGQRADLEAFCTLERREDEGESYATDHVIVGAALLCRF